MTTTATTTQGSTQPRRGSAKDEILGRIRTALADIPDLPPEQDVPVPWTYGRATRTEGVLDLFVERVEDYKAQVLRCRSEEVAARVDRALLDATRRLVRHRFRRLDGRLRCRR